MKVFQWLWTCPIAHGSVPTHLYSIYIIRHLSIYDTRFFKDQAGSTIKIKCQTFPNFKMKTFPSFYLNIRLSVSYKMQLLKTQASFLQQLKYSNLSKIFPISSHRYKCFSGITMTTEYPKKLSIWPDEHNYYFTCQIQKSNMGHTGERLELNNLACRTANNCLTIPVTLN